MKILVGFDGAESSINALNEAAQIAKKFSGSIIIITVHTEENQEEIKEIKKTIESTIDTHDVNFVFSLIIGSNPSKAIIDAATQEEVDLIVVGSRGLGKAASFLLGSVSKEVVSSAPCNILVVKQ